MIQINRVVEDKVSMIIWALLAGDRADHWPQRPEFDEGAMLMLRWIIAGSAAISMIPIAAAQTYDSNYPVCLQRWEWGGSTYVECTYTSWDQCRRAGRGLAAMCVNNLYWAQGQSGSLGGGRRRFAR
ncbi:MULTISPECIES: DUF3551 domain-containing protein [unclassified Bradyrhizobium]|uniref:DUF3551 domain-containing protein n=1 Tax=unclassified Bradyrhizobium TaxID=2631580 RepID=UPI0028EEF38F|nr:MULTISPECIES: DUF3551 domain-containing protein [unclassified Bradyrhizobium]